MLLSEENLLIIYWKAADCISACSNVCVYSSCWSVDPSSDPSPTVQAEEATSFKMHADH